MTFLLRAVGNGFALWITTLILSGIYLQGEVGPDSIFAGLSVGWQQVVYFVIAGLVLAAVNTVVRPIVKLLSLPLYLLTLGLFFFVVNALMLQLTAWITSHFAMSLVVETFGWALLGGILVGLVNWVIGALVRD